MTLPPEPPSTPLPPDAVGEGPPAIEPPPTYGYETYGDGMHGYGAPASPVAPGAWAPGYMPGYVQYQRTNGLAIASLVTGIVSIFFCWLGLILSVLAITLGFVGLNQIKNDTTQKGKGLAIAGIICGAIALLLEILLILMWIGLFAVSRNLETPPPG